MPNLAFGGTEVIGIQSPCGQQAQTVGAAIRVVASTGDGHNVFQIDMVKAFPARFF